MDFTKEFDEVPRNLSLEKLDYYGIRHGSLPILQDVNKKILGSLSKGFIERCTSTGSEACLCFHYSSQIGIRERLGTRNIVNDITTLETAQREAARFCLHNYNGAATVSCMLIRLEWDMVPL